METTLTPLKLHCEYLSQPINIAFPLPRLGWQVAAVKAGQRGLRQSAYQVLVASSEEQLATDTGDLWDSGKVVATQTTHIEYAGSPLQSRQQCWWKVRVWDQQDNVSAYSETSCWEMGLLKPEDWGEAHWIGLAGSQQATHEEDKQLFVEKQALLNSPYLRTTSTVAGVVRRARLAVTAKGLYEIVLNGERVGDAYFAPGWTDYSKRFQYQIYDVTDQLVQGENALGAILGTGWYSGYVAFFEGHLANHYGQEPRLLLQLCVEYTDGRQQFIVSDEGWQGRVGPIVYSDFLVGEAYDAREELSGWYQAGYKDEDWQSVLVEERDETLLVAQPDLPVRATETLRAQSVTEVAPGVHIVDLGQNMVGWVRLRVQGEAGTRVKLRHAEMLNPDGTLYITNLRSALQTDTYTLKGSGQEVFEPHFTFHGFRYVEITGYPGTPDVEAIEGIVLHSDTPVSGTFACSSSMVNQLQKNITWGQRGNFLSVPTDCPQRDERLGWMGDAQIFVRTACYNMDVAAFFSKWMVDVVDAQELDGAFTDVSPCPPAIKNRGGAPAWGDAGVIVPWTIYQMYGDKRILTDHYPAMVRWVQYIHEANPDHLWTKKKRNNYGDWLSIAASTPKDVLATAYFAYDALLLARIARVLGYVDDVAKYQTLHREISAAFCRAYVAEDGRIEGDTQTCYVLALQMQLLPESLRARAAHYLVEDIERKGGHLSTGFVGVGYLCPALTEAGYPEVAYRLLHNETFPSWGYSIRHGATTIWERWDGWTEEHGFQDPGMNSFNHYSLGSVGQWLYQYVAGIELDNEQPGFARISIRPYPDRSLSYARATYASLHGEISSYWQLGPDGFQLQVEIPANTTALIALPVSSQQRVEEGGKPVDEAEGVTFLRVEGDRTLFEVGSGRYAFRVI